MDCPTVACALMVWGYAVPAKNMPTNDSPVIVMASYQPVQGCNKYVNDIEFGSVCREVPPPRDIFKIKCPDGVMACHKKYVSLQPDWDKSTVMPLVKVYPPKQTKKKSLVRQNKNGSDGRIAGKSTEPVKPVSAQIAEQLAQQGVLYASQMGGSMAGFAVGGPIGAIVGGWAGCYFPKYEFIRQEWAVKEHWDLHPEKATGNQLYAFKMCSPLSFVFRAQEETEPHRKILAALGGLSWSPEPISAAIGQLAPAVPTMLDNLKLVGSVFKFSNTKTLFGQQREPYHKGPWIA